MKRVDAIGDICPMPVIKLKNALKEIETGVVEIKVDNLISKENIEKFSKELNYKYRTLEENGVYTIEVEKNQDNISNDREKKENIVVVVASDKMGEGDEELGKNLMKGFIYTLTEMDTLPNTIIFYNKGVLLVSQNQDIIKDVKQLEERGVEILSCGACANYYQVDKMIEVGEITNMYTIIERQMKASKVIKP